MIKKYGIVYILIGFIAMATVGIFYNYSIPNTIGDETVIMAATLKMIAEKSLRPSYPTNYHMPFGTYVYLPFFLALLAFLRLSGLFASSEELIEFGVLEFAKFLPMARFISVLLGVASVYLVYRISKKIFQDEFVALTASFLLATDIMFLYLAHFGKAWMPQIFVILLAFYFIVELYQRQYPKFKDYFKPALMTGISFGTHFIGVLVWVPFLAAHYLKNRGKKFSEIFISNKNFWISSVVVVFVMLLAIYLNPYGFTNYVGYSSFHAASLVSEALAVEENGTDLWQGISVYWSVLFEYGPVLLFLFLAGFILLFLRRRDIFWIFFSFLFAYYLVIGPLITSSKITHPHYVGPMIPFMAILAAYALACFYYGDIGRFFTRKIKIFLLILLFVAMLYPPFVWDRAVLRPSTYLEAQDWIYSNIPPGSGIINFHVHLPLTENKESLSDLKKNSPEFVTKRHEYLLALDESRYPRPNYYILVPDLYRRGVPEEVLSKNFDYAILAWGSGQYERVMSVAQKYGVKEENLVSIFPFGAGSGSFNKDIENIRKPLINLRKITHVGPIIAVYKLER